jgi:hypothetical protein
MPVRKKKVKCNKNTCLLLMSPGNYDGADILTFAREMTK